MPRHRRRWAIRLDLQLYQGDLPDGLDLGDSIAVDTETMVMAVMLFGLGGPIVSAGAPKVVVANFEGSSRGLAMGIYMTGPAIGGIVSLTLTNSLLLPVLDNSWRAVMMLWGGVAFAAAVAWFLIASRQPGKAEPATTAGVSQLRVIGNLISKPTVVIVLGMSVCVFLFNHGQAFDCGSPGFGRTQKGSISSHSRQLSRIA